MATVRAGTLVAALLMSVTGFSHAQDCYDSSIVSPTPFMGNNGEVFRLDDGSIWEVKYEYEYLYEYYPTVVICPSRGTMVIGDKTVNVELVGRQGQQGGGDDKRDRTPNVIESRIEGDFEGWEGDTIFKLTNGQIWQQTDGRYKYKYKYRPKVMILRTGSGYEMQVDGVDGRIRVTRLE